MDGFPNTDEDERPYRRHLFMVRLWQEESGTGQVKWRGQVQCASDGERHVFRDWPDLVAFLIAKLQEARNDGES